MLMECYFDDSSDPRREKYYACGGLVGSQAQWDRFEIAWSHRTHALREPFRATDCECGHGQFENWPKSECDALMSDLVGLLNALQFYGFASIVPIASFKQIFPALDDRDAFRLTVTQTIINMAYIADAMGRDVELWFEHGTGKGAILEVFDSLRNLKGWKPSQRLRGVHLEPKDLRPLQAADLVAREAFKHIDNLGSRPTRKPVRRMSANLCFILWTDEVLKYLAANGGPGNLKLLANYEGGKNPPRFKHFWRPQKVQ